MSAPSASDVKLKGWNAGQVQRAVQSLLKYIGKQQEKDNSLLADDDELIYLQLALKTMPLKSQKHKPIPIPLPHPLFDPEGADICLFVKDHQGEGHKEAKKRLEQYERKGGISKVLGISKLRTKYESHESKRELCRSYDLFLADDRIVPSLPKLLGKSFFSKKKQPIPIRLTAKDVPSQVKKACSATYMFQNSGTCINLRIGRCSHSTEDLVDNINTALTQAVRHIPKKWDNIQGVFLKTVESVALPIFQTLPDAPARISIDAAPATQQKQTKSGAQAKATSNGHAVSNGVSAKEAAPKQKEQKASGNEKAKPVNGMKRPASSSQQKAAKKAR